jgi:hypothetical protein
MPWIHPKAEDPGALTESQVEEHRTQAAPRNLVDGEPIRFELAGALTNTYSDFTFDT